MGRNQKQILVGLAAAMFLGLVVYMRLWTIDYSMSTDEAELLRSGSYILVCFSRFVGYDYRNLYEKFRKSY